MRFFYYLLFMLLAACTAEPETAVSPTPPLAKTTTAATATTQPTATAAAPPTSTATPSPTPEPMSAVQGHAAESYIQVSWSPDGRLLASGGNDNKVIVWDAASLEPIYSLTHPDMAFSRFTSFSPGGRWLMVSEGRHTGQSVFFDVSIWDLQTGTRLERTTDLASVWDVAWSPDGSLLAYWDFAAQEFHFWAAPDSDTTVPEQLDSPPLQIEEIRLQADGTVLAVGVGGDEYGLNLWRSTTPDSLTPLRGTYINAEPDRAVFSPDGSLVATVATIPTTSPESEAGVGIFVWDTATGELGYTLASQDFYRLAGMTLSPDNALLATGLADDVRLWDLASGGVAATLPGQSAPAYDLAFSPDGKTVAAGEADGEIRLWQMAAYLQPPITPTPMPTVTPVAVSDVQPVLVATLPVHRVSPDGPGSVASLRWLDENSFRLMSDPYLFDENSVQQRLTDYDLTQGQVISSWLVTADKQFHEVSFLATYSPDGDKVAYWLRQDIYEVEDDTVGVFESATNSLLFEIGSDQIGTGNEIAWSPDGSQIAVQTFTAIEVVDVLRGSHVMSLAQAGGQNKSVLWSPDGAWIAASLQGTASDGGAAVWDAESGRLVHEIDDAVRDIAFSPDGRTLLMVQPERVDLLNVATGELEPLPDNPERIHFPGNGAWSADGVYVALYYQRDYWGPAFLLIWNTQTGSQTSLGQGEISGEYGGVANKLVWSPVRPWIAVHDQGFVQIIDVEREMVMRIEAAVTPWTGQLVWSPDGRRLAVVSSDGIVKIWGFAD